MAPTPAPLLALPAEIRNRIYSLVVLDQHDPAKPQQDTTILRFLLTCRQIHHEAFRLAFSNIVFTTSQWNCGGFGSTETTLANKVHPLRPAKRRAIRNMTLKASYYMYGDDHTTLLHLFGHPLTNFYRAGLDLEELRITLDPRALEDFGGSHVHSRILRDVSSVVVDAVAQMGRLKRVFVILVNRVPEDTYLRLYKEIEPLVKTRLAKNGWITTQDSAGRIMIVDLREDRVEQKRVRVELVADSASCI